MVENLKDVQERAAEESRARAERREPDFSEENLALYRVPQHFNDPNRKDESHAEPQAVTTGLLPPVPPELLVETEGESLVTQEVVHIDDVATVVDEKSSGKHSKAK